MHIPLRTNLTVLPADKPSKPIGWTVKETVGISVVNTRGMLKFNRTLLFELIDSYWKVCVYGYNDGHILCVVHDNDSGYPLFRYDGTYNFASSGRVENNSPVVKQLMVEESKSLEIKIETNSPIWDTLIDEIPKLWTIHNVMNE